MPADLEPDLGALGFDGTIAVQARQDVGDTEFLLALADRHPLIKGVVGWVDLCSPDVGRQLDAYAKHPALVGVRHVVHDEPDDDFMLRPDFRAGIARLRDYGLTYDLLLFPKHLSRAVSLVDEFPGSALRPRSHREAADARAADVAMGRGRPPARRASQCRLQIVGTRHRGPMGQLAAGGHLALSRRRRRGLRHVAADDRIRLARVHARGGLRPHDGRRDRLRQPPASRRRRRDTSAETPPRSTASVRAVRSGPAPRAAGR